MIKPIIFSLLLLTTLSCNTQNKTEPPTTDNETDGWIYLFDGTGTEGWRAYNGETLSPRWSVKDSVLTYDPEIKVDSTFTGTNDIIYGKEEFDNFELYLEWKLPPAGNSGIFYHLKEGYDGPPDVAPEYQLIDDLKWGEINNSKLEAWQKVAADYAMHIPDSTVKIVKPAGEWNTSRIRFTPDLVEHWLNGVKVVSFKPWTDDWYKRKAAGKWKDYPDYGKYKTGYIGLQAHGSPLWFRNIKIKKL